MPQDTVLLAFELEVPLTLVSELVKRHLLRTLLKSTNGQALPDRGPGQAPNGQAPHPEEEAAPALPSSAGVP
jgi:hypothetical protein